MIGLRGVIGLRAPALGVVLVLALTLAPRARAAPFAGVMPDMPTAGHARVTAPVRAHAANVDYDGGPVMHSNRTHLIFWQPAGAGLAFDPGYESQLETYLARVATASHLPTNVNGLSGQYTDTAGQAAYDSSYGGAILDVDPLPASSGCTEPPPPPAGTGPGWTDCASGAQIDAEIGHFVVAHHLPTGMSDLYFLVTPNGLGSCEGSGPGDCALGGPASGYCGFHSVTDDGAVLYAVIPYNALAGHCQSTNPRPNSSTADPTISTVAHEQNETVTDPLGTAWLDNQGNEIADLCITDYGPNLGGSSGDNAYDELINGGRYYIQELWSNAAGACEPSAPADLVSFTVPRTVPGDRRLALAGQASFAAGEIASYEWFFSGAASASGRHVSHVFTSLGTSAVILRTVDTWENWGFAGHTIQVVRPGRPVTTITAGPPARRHAARARFRFDSTAPVATFQCRVDRGRWTACRSPHSTATLRPGAHVFSVRARDVFGQLSRKPAVYRFTVL